MTDIRLGVLCWNQYTDWPSFLEAGVRADELGYDTLWTWDHLYPIIGDSHGPIFEGWLAITAWAQATERIRIGLMVGANTFRNPALVAKMATTHDHISNGRTILGIGAAWFEEEHRDFGIEFGSGPPERLRWLGEALPIMRGMLDGTEPSATGPALSLAAHAQPAATDPGPPADRHRRRRREGDPQARREVRRHVQHRRRTREGATQGRDPRRALRKGRARSGRDRTDDEHRHRLHPRRHGQRRSVCSRRPSSATGSLSPGRTSRSAPRRTSRRSSRRTSRSATAT